MISSLRPLCSRGQYGVEEGLIFSYPCRVQGGKLQVVENIQHKGYGKEKFDATHTELKKERDTVKEMGVI